MVGTPDPESIAGNRLGGFGTGSVFALAPPEGYIVALASTSKGLRLIE